ncbi:bifunctional phosphoribosylaminoimidazolecarboxamide formyltransferase/IMP cyclohydrolase [candidate division KSB1 bacterium]
MPNIKTALLSVYDKTGIVEFARSLVGLNIDLISTGGTSELLRKNGIEHRQVEDLTKFPERLDGRVKTLHPHIFMGILARREVSEHLRQLAESDLTGIDMVVVNLYPFEQTIKEKHITVEKALEHIDIGGVSLLRAAAKNFNDVVAVTSPDRYDETIELLKTHSNTIPQELSGNNAAGVFALTAHYDSCIGTYLSQAADGRELPGNVVISMDKVQSLRYGENPHQRASLYCAAGEQLPYEQLHGKELSYNNIVDIDSALSLAFSYDRPTTAIIKHTNPCGLGSDDMISEAYDKAFSTDPASAFGGIIACNRAIDEKTAEKISKIFVEVVAAPDFEDNAFETLSRKKNIRIIKVAPLFDPERVYREIKRIHGGYLLQERDTLTIDPSNLNVVTKRAPTEQEMESLLFGWKMIRYVKSNAIVYCTRDRTLGIGTGQMSRVDASEIAVMKAKKQGLDLKGSCVISDAFFPFRDGVDAAAAAGATAVIQPGGSVRDEEVITACNEQNLAMVFTGIRHFKH